MAKRGGPRVAVHELALALLVAGWGVVVARPLIGAKQDPIGLRSILAFRRQIRALERQCEGRCAPSNSQAVYRRRQRMTATLLLALLVGVATISVSTTLGAVLTAISAAALGSYIAALAASTRNIPQLSRRSSINQGDTLRGERVIREAS